MEQAAQKPRLDGKRLILGVSGGIAAYKACDLASRLVKEKAQVTAILTESAQKFVTPFSFEALTGRPCLTDAFKRIAPNESPYPHIDPAVKADLVVLAPATADLIARLAAGIADDLLTTLCLTARCPIIVCPAMNVQMWEHPATRRNVKTIQSFGHRLLGPDDGTLACGMTGAGRLLEPAEIVEHLCVISADPSRSQYPGSGSKARVRRRRGGKKPKRDDPNKSPGEASKPS